MPTASRIIKTRFAARAFDGEGARLYGGRWSSVGVRMVYTAGSVSLAVLEILVHLENTNVLPSYSLCAVHFDDALMSSLDRSRLPAHWRESPGPPELLSIGDAWAASRLSAVLEVPSAVVEDESNYLINPDHPDFASLVIDPPRPFAFDPRLLRWNGQIGSSQSRVAKMKGGDSGVSVDLLLKAWFGAGATRHEIAEAIDQ